MRFKDIMKEEFNLQNYAALQQAITTLTNSVNKSVGDINKQLAALKDEESKEQAEKGQQAKQQVAQAKAMQQKAAPAAKLTIPGHSRLGGAPAAAPAAAPA